MGLVQIVRHEGWIERVKPEAVPVFELSLQENQRVVNFEANSTKYRLGYEDRKTVDWHWVAWVETRL